MRMDYFGTKKYVKMECLGVKKNVMFHQPGSIPGPHTDGTTIHVMEPNGGWSELEWLTWEYEVYHEIGHEAEVNSHPHWRDYCEENKIATNTLLGSLWNLIDDHVQEHNRVGKYVGRDKIIKKGRSIFVNDRLLDNKKMLQHEETKPASIFKVVAIYDTVCRQDWNEYLVGAGHTASLSLDGYEREIYDKIYTSGIKFQEGKNTVDAYRMAKEILDVIGEDSKEHEKESQKAFERCEKGEVVEGEGEGGEGDGEGGEGTVTGELSKEDKAAVEAMQPHVHYQKPKPGENSYQANHDIHISYENLNNTNVGTFSPKDPDIIDLKSEKYCGKSVDPARTRQFVKAIQDVDGGKVLAGQVKKLLISMKQRRWDHGHKRGHISSKNLWKARGPIYDSQVFKRRANTLDIDSAVSILTDNSGSMSRHKFPHAARAGIMLNEAMSKVGVPVELLSFSEDTSGPNNIIVKSFMDRENNEDVLTERYATCSNWMNQNSDGESIMWAYERLMKRKEKRKILIVLSDGSPAAYNGHGRGSEYHFTAQVIKKIEKDTPVEIYGLGIMDHNVEKLYSEYKVLQKAEDLEDMLLNLVKQKILS